ncbi:MAG: 2-hydroxyglutaryl-CoA dehydratase [Clostridia bacterium]|nr:2-hydroxyglutaryl-CoA dehydratase [Clostridia bacterium]
MNQKQTEYPVFTKEMKKTHTILVPMMLPIHMALMAEILRQEGYNVDILTNDGHGVVDEGLRSVHNDACYPALLVIGQFLDALRSGKYDPHKVALIITQTGGGCRASNYIFLLRKALEKSGYGYVPVISLNTLGLEENPGFQITVPLAIKMLYAAIVGDFLMLVSNQCRPYECNAGNTDRLVWQWTQRIVKSWNGKKLVRYRTIRKWYKEILHDFAQIEQRNSHKIKVGIVGEIYVKYSPMGNNHLEDFLLSEGAEVVVPGLLDFCMYCIYNGIVDRKLYGGGLMRYLGSQTAYRFFLKKQKDAIRAVRQHGVFRPAMLFSRTKDLAEQYIGKGMKMGEGWLLTVEMAELIESGVHNVVCTQPFGCLPNHIAGKGMIHKIKAVHPEANIVAIDYDPGASEVNQQNRIKLMLANARAQDSEFQSVTSYPAQPAKKRDHKPAQAAH